MSLAIAGELLPLVTRHREERAARVRGVLRTGLALAPEDEAREIARRALGAGHRRALLLRPAGDWGDKVAAALRAAWTGGGGTVAATATFASRETHSDAIEQALHLDRSAARGAALRRLLDRGTVLAGRRREDIDVVFMLAPGTDAAKSLKPLLDYHYAGDLPVYATSAANSAEVSGGDRDLAGLRLVELPWLLGAQPALREAVAGSGLRQPQPAAVPRRRCPPPGPEPRRARARRCPGGSRRHRQAHGQPARRDRAQPAPGDI